MLDLINEIRDSRENAPGPLWYWIVFTIVACVVLYVALMFAVGVTLWMLAVVIPLVLLVVLGVGEISRTITR